MSTGDWPPARGRGHVLEEVTFLLGSQSMRRSFPGRDKGKGSPGRAYFQRHGDRRDHGVSWKCKTVGSPWLQPGLHCVTGEGNEEMMLERRAGSPILGLPSVHCGEPEVFREESDKIYVMITWWGGGLCGRGTGESQPDGREASRYELYLEGPSQL